MSNLLATHFTLNLLNLYPFYSTGSNGGIRAEKKQMTQEGLKKGHVGAQVDLLH